MTRRVAGLRALGHGWWGKVSFSVLWGGGGDPRGEEGEEEKAPSAYTDVRKAALGHIQRAEWPPCS